jgi:hypothetical protein
MSHSYTSNCAVSVDPAVPDELRVRSTMEVVRGTPLTLNYGWSSNDHFLLNYGFVLDDNPSDAIEIAKSWEAIELAVEMSGEEGAATTPWKVDIANQCGLGRRGVSAAAASAALSSSSPAHFTLTRDVLDAELIALIRVMLAHAQEHPPEQRTREHFIRDALPLQAAKSADASDASGVAVTNQWIAPVQNLALLEPAVLRVLFSYLSLLQSTFPTSVSEDVTELSQLLQDAMLASPDAERAEQVQRTEIAIRFRIGKKRILAEQMLRVQRCM